MIPIACNMLLRVPRTRHTLSFLGVAINAPLVAYTSPQLTYHWYAGRPKTFVLCWHQLTKTSAAVAILTQDSLLAKGFCKAFDGEELPNDDEPRVFHVFAQAVPVSAIQSWLLHPELLPFDDNT